MGKFGEFVNFMGVNSHFLSDQHNCKPLFLAPNRLFHSPPLCFKTQTRGGFQRRITRWQNTIFGFLTAQLDFLAIFPRAP